MANPCLDRRPGRDERQKGASGDGRPFRDRSTLAGEDDEDSATMETTAALIALCMERE